MIKSAVLLLLTMLLLCSLYAEDDIQLPDIIITGESEILQDNLRLNERLRKYWTVADLQPLKYQPILEQIAVKPYQEDFKEYFRYLNLDWGTKQWGTFRAGITSPQNNLLALSTKLAYLRQSNDRTLFTGALYWTPIIKTDTDIDLVSRAKYTDFNNKLTNQITLSGFDLALSSDKLPLINLPFINNYLNLGLTQHIQKYSTDTTLNDIDIEAGSSFDAGKIKVPVNYSLIRKISSAKAGLTVDSLFVFDDIGFWGLVDNTGIIFTPSFLWNIDLSDFFRIHLQNDPQILGFSRSELLADNYEQPIKMVHRVGKLPYNASLSLENKRYLPIALSYKYQHYFDYIYYKDNPISPDLFEQDTSNLIKQQFLLALAYHFYDFDFSGKLAYNQFDKALPFLPEWEGTVRLSWNHDNLRTTVTTELQYLAERKDLQKQRMKDSYLLSLSARKRITNYLTLDLAAINILDEIYRKYELSNPTIRPPAERFRLQGGFSFYF